MGFTSYAKYLYICEGENEYSDPMAASEGLPSEINTRFLEQRCVFVRLTTSPFYSEALSFWTY
jgi:hypothetical protein